MALFEGYKRVEGSRSNTALVKSGHMSPAEEWILDPSFKNDKSLSSVFNDGVLFTYNYGGPGMEEIVIPKGRMVGVSTPVKDFVSKKFKTVMTLPGLALNGNTIGMVPYNLAKDLLQEDRFGGNQPSIITMDYVTLPYIPTATPASTMDKTGMLQEEQELSINNKMPWGAAIGRLEVGDYVKSTASGRITKWEKGTDGAELIVGQVLACDLNQESWGWLKWMLWDESEIREDDAFMNRSGASNLPTDAGYPFDPQYSEGNYMYQYVHQTGLTDPTGIPGLHDGSGNYLGYGKNDTEYTDIVLGSTPDSVSEGTLMAFQAKDFAGGNLVNLREVIEVKVGESQVEAENMTIDYKKGIITIKLGAADASKEVKATYKAFHYGTSSYMDFKGVQGAMHILLKK